MLFNSYEFLCVFLPIAVTVFYALGRFSRNWSLGWLIAASLFFYAWWRPLNLLIIAPSILVNFALARQLQRLGPSTQPRLAKWVLGFGIVFNVAFLGYFKYANFGATVANDLFGTSYSLERIVLPLGISFITFQKIALLIDAHAGRLEAFTLKDYCLFVLFFPQLIAGPIVHLRELMPQFRRCACRFNAGDVSVGLTLFAFGLFKKVCLADTLAPLAGAVYESAAGQSVSLLPAWIAALGFTFQIYFDFSGYSDMAVGAARLFGIKLPPNFDSPIRASSIIDFWRPMCTTRWH
jgi:alginate O-acetyltransferase complex protein AlgI